MTKKSKIPFSCLKPLVKILENFDKKTGRNARESNCAHERRIKLVHKLNSDINIIRTVFSQRTCPLQPIFAFRESFKNSKVLVRDVVELKKLKNISKNYFKKCLIIFSLLHKDKAL